MPDLDDKLKLVLSEESPQGEDSSTSKGADHEFVLQLMRARGSTHVPPDPNEMRELREQISRMA